MSTAAALEAARKGFLRLAVTAPLRRGSVDSMLVGCARAVEDLAATGDADELAEQVARVRAVAELWAGVVRALDAAVPGSVVLCKPCYAAQQAEPVELPERAPVDACARCGEALSAPEPASPVRHPWPAALPLLAAEQAALAGLVLWSEARESETATVEQVAAAEQRLSLLAGVVRRLRAESPRVRS